MVGSPARGFDPARGFRPSVTLLAPARPFLRRVERGHSGLSRGLRNRYGSISATSCYAPLADSVEGKMLMAAPTNTERSRAARERQKYGQGIFKFVGDEVFVLEILCESGLLSSDDTEDREKVSRALSKWFSMLKEKENEQ